MINEAAKGAFIQQTYFTREDQVTAWKTLELMIPFEDIWGADFCTRSADDLSAAYSEVLSRRFGFNSRRIRIFRSYIQWAIDNGIEGANSDGLLAKVDTAFEAAKDRMIRNPLDLKMFLDTIFFDPELKSKDEIDKCAAWLAYAGIPLSDIVYVKTTDVDFEHMVIRYCDEEFPLYPEGIDCFRFCVNSKTFMTQRGPHKTWIEVERTDGDELIRVEPMSSQIDHRYFSRHIKARSNDEAVKPTLDRPDITMYDIFWSGLYYITFQREIAGIAPDYAFLVRDKSGRNSTASREFLRQRKYNSMRDYNTWKSVVFSFVNGIER